MIDRYDDKNTPESLQPLNAKAVPDTDRATAVAIKKEDGKLPTITAAGFGKLAEEILQIAFENDIKVREDSDLALMLAKLEVDTDIPSEALFAVAEILTQVYKANGQPNPFDAILDNPDLDAEAVSERLLNENLTEDGNET